MDSTHLNNFLKSCEVVKQDLTCGVCLELCKKPVTLKTCFHIICEEHLDNLDKCPTCKMPLLDKAVFRDDRLEKICDSTKKLDEILAPLKALSAMYNLSN